MQALSEQISSRPSAGPRAGGSLGSRAIAYSNMEQPAQALAGPRAGRAGRPDARGGLSHARRGVHQCSADTTRRWRISNACAGSIPESQRFRAAGGTRRSCAAIFVPRKPTSGTAVETQEGEDRLHAVIWFYLATARLGEDARAADRRVAGWSRSVAVARRCDSAADGGGHAGGDARGRVELRSQDRGPEPVRGVLLPRPLPAAGRRPRGRPARISERRSDRGQALRGVRLRQDRAGATRPPPAGTTARNER